MTAPDAAAGAFDPGCLKGLDQPVRRYFEHALAPGAPLARGMQLDMTGRIDVGLWMPFQGRWEGDGRSFRWSVTSGPFGLRVLRVVDRFEDRHGSMDIRLRPGLKLLHAADEDTARSAAGRAAAEAIWAPMSLLPERGVTWLAESDEVIVATWDVPPERPRLCLRIDADGAVRTASLMRWDNGQHGLHGYIPCGGDVLEHRRFGHVTIPSRISVGWWYGTPRYKPFFEATITAAAPSRRSHVNDSRAVP
jgi:hypothetical protein